MAQRGFQLLWPNHRVGGGCGYRGARHPRQPSLDLPHKTLNYHFIFSVTKGTDLSRHQKEEKKKDADTERQTHSAKERVLGQAGMDEGDAHK